MLERDNAKNRHFCAKEGYFRVLPLPVLNNLQECHSFAFK